MDPNQAPKQFCDNISVSFTEEHFSMLLFSGTESKGFALSPAHMKRLAQYLTFQMAEFERRYGPVSAEWKPGIESPIQTKDLETGRES